MTGQKYVRKLEKSPYFLLKRAAQFAADVYAANAGKNGLTQRQFTLLTVVDAFEGVSQTDLVKSTGIDRSTLADMISRLTAQGYLQRTRSKDDARTNVVRLTSEGRQVMLSAQPGASTVDKKIMSVIPVAKRKAFIEVLQILANQAGEDSNAKPRNPAKGSGGKAAHA